MTRSYLVKTNPPSQDIFDKIQNTFGYPCFVKPNKNGGSYGVTKVHCRDSLTEAVNKAFSYDNEALVECSVEGGLEVTCTVHNFTFDRQEGIEIS